AFGIAYRACRGSTSFHHGYDLPSGPAFADEDEFEQEMGAEFRVAPVLSTNGGMIAGGSERERTDDFSENRGNSSGDRDTTRRGQKRDMVSPVSKMDSQNALQQVTKEYKQAESPSKRDENTALPLDPSSTERGEGINGKRQANVTGISTHVGKDVRQYPVMEGDDEQEVEGEEEVERDAEDGGEPKRVAADDLSRNPDGHRGCKEDEQSNRNDQDEDARRALVAREWEVIDQLRTAEGAVPMKIGVGGSLQPLSIDEGNRVISTEEVLRYFRSQDHTLYKAVIIPFQPRETRFGLFRRIPTLKFSDGKKLRDEIFIYAQMKYTPDDVVHRRLIQTVFRRLTKEQRACPDVGSHWDTIGFQGTDPCTDLNRSMGIFALLQVLYFLDTQPALAIRLYRLSVVDVTGWPFLCVSIGFTKEALGVLRRGSCYCECNRRKVVMDVVNELHQAQFYAFLELCRTEPALHHALHLSKVRSLIESDSHAMVKAYRVYLTENEVSSAKGFVEKGGSAA
ncbi:unnamed protein product, partial [Hapterophycus canaliculatus]